MAWPIRPISPRPPSEVIVKGKNKSTVPFGFRRSFDKTPSSPERRTRDEDTIKFCQEVLSEKD